VDEINAAGGVLGKRLRVFLEDDQSRPEEAATAATKLINQNRVVAMLGEASSSRSLAAAPICQANRVPMVSPSSTNPRVTEVGDYIFRVCFIDSFAGSVMARFAAGTLVALLVDVRNDYSIGLSTFFHSVQDVPREAAAGCLEPQIVHGVPDAPLVFRSGTDEGETAERFRVAPLPGRQEGIPLEEQVGVPLRRITASPELRVNVRGDRAARIGRGPYRAVLVSAVRSRLHPASQARRHAPLPSVPQGMQSKVESQ
jgi:hypothetical protein